MGLSDGFERWTWQFLKLGTHSLDGLLIELDIKDDWGSELFDKHPY